MDESVIAVGYRTSETVRLRTKSGQHDLRRMWGGIVWPELVQDQDGAVCIVGELMPNEENIPLGQLALLDYETAKTIDGLLSKTIDLKDHYWAKRFFVDIRNEGWFEKFKRADGLRRYKKEHDDIKFFPHFRDKHLVARIEEAPQANDPEFGLQIIYDYLYHEHRLKITRSVQETLEKNGDLPISKSMVKTGVSPVIKALGFVLSAYFKHPFYGPHRQLTNWRDHMRSKDHGGFKEVVVD